MSTFYEDENLTLPAPTIVKLPRNPSEQRMRSSSKQLGERKRLNSRKNFIRSNSPRRDNKKSSPRQNRRKSKQSQSLSTRIQQWFVTSFSCISSHSVVSQSETRKVKFSKSPRESSKSTPPCTPQNSQSLYSKTSNDDIFSDNNVDNANSHNTETRSDCPSVSFSYQQMFLDRDTTISQANNKISSSSQSIPLKSILKKPKSDSDDSSPPEPSFMIEGAISNTISSDSSITDAMPMSSAANTAHLSHHVAFKRPPPIRTSCAHNFSFLTTPSSPTLNRAHSQSSIPQQPILLARTLRRVQSEEHHQFTNVSYPTVKNFYRQAPSSFTASSVNLSYSNTNVLTLPPTSTSVSQPCNHLYHNPIKSHPTSPSSLQQQRTLLHIPSVNSSASFQHRVEQELKRKRSVEEEDFMLAVRLSQEDILHTHHHSQNNSTNSRINSHNSSFITTSSTALSRTSSFQTSSPTSSFFHQERLTSPHIKHYPSWSNPPLAENKSNVEEEEEVDESVFRVSSSSSVINQAHSNYNNLIHEVDDDVALELAMRQSLDEDVKHRQRLEIREKLALSRALVASVATSENLTVLKSPSML